MDTRAEGKIHGKPKGGFTLLEVLIAVAVLAIGVVGVVNLFPVGLHAAKRTADFSRVAMLAQKQMELYRAHGYSNMSVWGTGYPSGSSAEVFPSPYGDFRWRIDWEGINGNLMEATLRIYWVDRGSEVYESFITYITDL